MKTRASFVMEPALMKELSGLSFFAALRIYVKRQ